MEITAVARDGSSITTHEPPSQTDGRGTFSVASWNIRSGRNGSLEAALRAMESLGVDIGILQETKLTKGIYTRRFGNYSVIATDANSVSQGGVALFWRESDDFEVEEVIKHGPNVISFHLVTGADRFYIVGCYIPPSDTDALEEVAKAWQQCPKDCLPMLVGDLNVDLDTIPMDERGMAIAEQVDAMDLTCMTRQFGQRRRRRVRGRWTWRMRRGGRWISSHPDYFLGRRHNRGKFRNVSLRLPRHFDSDHRAIVAEFYSGPPKRLKAYRRRRQRFPIRLPRVGPRTELETAFEDLQSNCMPPPPRKVKANAWISDATWAIVDRRATLRHMGWLDQAGTRRIGREIKARLKADRSARATKTANDIEGHLGAGELKEA